MVTSVIKGEVCGIGEMEVVGKDKGLEIES